jgi:hypothetical protein
MRKEVSITHPTLQDAASLLRQRDRPTGKTALTLRNEDVPLLQVHVLTPDREDLLRPHSRLQDQCCNVPKQRSGMLQIDLLLLRGSRSASSPVPPGVVSLPKKGWTGDSLPYGKIQHETQGRQIPFAPAAEHCLSRATLNRSISAVAISSSVRAPKNFVRGLRAHAVPLVRVALPVLDLGPGQEFLLHEHLKRRALPLHPVRHHRMPCGSRPRAHVVRDAQPYGNW